MTFETGPDYTVRCGYMDTAPEYRAAGWTQVIPLPEGAKFPPPKNTTGSGQQPVTEERMREWGRINPYANLGIVMPDTVIALDVDSADGHAGKTDGAIQLARLEKKLGPLPATWCSSAHGGDSPYRHRFYLVPKGMRFDGGAAPGIDIIQHDHRYAVAWPSIHPNGGEYHWYTPHGDEYEGCPNIGQLATLPDTWVEHLRRHDATNTMRRVNTTPAPRIQDDARMCKAINTYLNRILAAPARKGSRHDTMLQAAWALVRFQEEGHRGALDALAQLKPYFIREVAPDRKGGEREAEHEFNSIVTTALEKNTGIPDSIDPCETTPIERMTPREADTLNRNAPTTQKPGENRASSTGPVEATTTTGTADTEPAIRDDPQENDMTETMPSSWLFEDLTQYASGEPIPPTPTVFQREDGQGLFYRGCVNDLHGEPGCGKSLIAQIAAAQELKEGHDVIYIDYEDNAKNIVKRLLLLDVPGNLIVSHLHYVRPNAKPNAPTSISGWRQTLDYADHATLTIIDGVTSCLAYQGLDSNNGDDIAAWYNTMPRLIANHGPAVVLIDHVIKNKEGRGRYAGGSMQKLALIDGISYMVDMLRPIGKGIKGVIVIRSGKDRISEIEEHCSPSWSSNGSHLREAARINIYSTDPLRMRTIIERPNMMPSQAQDKQNDFRPTGLMEKISTVISDSGEIGFNALMRELKEDGSSARRSTVKHAIGLLCDEEYLSKRSGANNTTLYSSNHSYKQINDVASDKYMDRLLQREANEINEEDSIQDLGIDDF